MQAHSDDGLTHGPQLRSPVLISCFGCSEACVDPVLLELRCVFLEIKYAERLEGGFARDGGIEESCEGRWRVEGAGRRRHKR